jgi:hypothetical protein
VIRRYRCVTQLQPEGGGLSVSAHQMWGIHLGIHFQKLQRSSPETKEHIVIMADSRDMLSVVDDYLKQENVYDKIRSVLAEANVAAYDPDADVKIGRKSAKKNGLESAIRKLRSSRAEKKMQLVKGKRYLLVKLHTGKGFVDLDDGE